MGFLAQLGVVVLTQSVARKPFHDKCNIKKPTKNKAFSLNLATFAKAPVEKGGPSGWMERTLGVRGAAASFAKSTTEHLQAPRPQKTE